MQSEKDDSQTGIAAKTEDLSDCDDFEMDEVIAEFAEEEKKNAKKIIQFSDNEDEMDSLLQEFAETQSNSSENDKCNSNVIIASDGEDEIENLIDEFSKENELDL